MKPAPSTFDGNKPENNPTDGHLSSKLNDSSIDRVMAIDLDERIIAWNKTSELISGFSKEDVLGKKFTDAFPLIKADDEMVEAISQAMKGRKTFLPSRSGFFNREYVENHFIPLLDDDGHIIGVLNIMHDVAHRIKAEKQLEKLNLELEKKYAQLEKANKDLATFTYIASRDIKEPIRHVYTSLEMMARKEGGNLSNVSRGNLRKMQASLNKINLLLDDLLAISTITNDSSRFRPVDLNTVFSEVSRKMADKLLEKNASLHADALPVVNGSITLLEYLLTQLIDNAIKFHKTDVAPQILITCQKRVSDEHEQYEISVSDNGIGFEMKDAERIFNMFEKLDEQNYRGSGIGLAICKKIMDAHEGKIWASGEPGRGTQVTCSFDVPKN